MFKDSFTEDDREIFVKLLNFFHNKAVFKDMTIKDSLDLNKLLTYSQTKILPKIEKNIVEIKEVIDSNPEPEEEI